MPKRTHETEPSNIFKDFKNSPPEGTKLLVIALLARIKQQGISLEQAGRTALKEIEPSKDYDTEYSKTEEAIQKAIDFLKSQGIK